VTRGLVARHLCRRTGLLMPPSTAGHLHQGGKQAFRRSEIRVKQLRVGIGHQHQTHTRKVMPLCQHLRAHHNIHITTLNSIQFGL
jgi:hypothetical protein